MNDGRAIALLKIAKVIKMLSTPPNRTANYRPIHFSGLLLADFDRMVYLCEA
jgi:hypothetical protein